MTNFLQLFIVLGLAFFTWGVFILGKAFGEASQRDKWQRHMDRCNDYIFAVKDLDLWCGHVSPHAKLIARHLRAHGEGQGYNGGTPIADEACSIDGLRQQLAHLDAAIKAATKESK